MSKKNKIEILELTIDSLAFEGVAVSRHEGKVYFIKGGLPGEKVLARVLKKRKSYAEGVVLEILEKSPERIEPECSHFGICGGCSWQSLSYENQLIWKRRHVADALERIGKIIPKEGLLDAMPAPQIFGYRNKMEFSFGGSRWLTEEEIAAEENIEGKKFALGLHIPGRFDKILNIDKCHIQPEKWNDVLNCIKEKAMEQNLAAYHQLKHEGFLRNLVFRKTDFASENLVMLITTTPKSQEEIDFVSWYDSEIPRLFPWITNLVHAVTDSFSPVAIGEPRFIKGNSYITESILGVKYRISPFSFFQTNSGQLDNFISKILEFADLQPDDILWDLYCGTGSISLPAAKNCKEVYGIELVESSVLDAKSNALLNEIDNAKFFCEDLHSKQLEDIIAPLPVPDKIIIDPPRAGMHKNLAEWIANSGCPRVVYVSCNPATQARDLELLSENYDLIKVQPVDMFPQTYHVESIALLIRREN